MSCSEHFSHPWCHCKSFNLHFLHCLRHTCIVPLFEWSDCPEETTAHCIVDLVKLISDLRDSLADIFVEVERKLVEELRAFVSALRNQLQTIFQVFDRL